MRKTLVTAWLAYVQNILQPLFDVVGPTYAFAYIAYAIIRSCHYAREKMSVLPLTLQMLVISSKVKVGDPNESSRVTLTLGGPLSCQLRRPYSVS